MHPRIHGLKWHGEIDHPWERGCCLTRTDVSEKITGYKQLPAGHYQPFKNPTVTRSPLIGIAKLLEAL